MKHNAKYIAALLTVSLLCIAPYALLPIGADRFNIQTLQQCFAQGFWYGDFYPRWCFLANAQLGVQAFIFYFPLGFWISSLFYPLTFAGMQIETWFALSMGLASLACGITCYHWLRDTLSRRAACTGAIIYMLAPYATELRVVRAAYAELWLMALLPLLALCTLRLCAKRKNAVAWLSLTYAACMLAHLPCALIAGLGMACYIVCGGRTALHALPRLAVGMMAGMAISAFYWLPAAYYQQFNQQLAIPARYLPMVNSYPRPTPPLTDMHLKLYACTALTILLLLALNIFLLRSRATPTEQKEFRRWMGVFALSLIWFLPFLESFWEQIPLARTVFLPWRMQLLWPLVLAYGAAVYAQRTRAPAYYLACIALALALFALPAAMQETPILNALKDLHKLNAYEYHTLWMNDAADSRETIAAHARDFHLAASTDDVVVKILQWGPEDIRLHIESPPHATHPIQLLIYHRYFPSWLAEGARLLPQQGSGLMLLEAKPGSQGSQDIALRHAPYAAGPWWVCLSPWASGITLILCIIYIISSYTPSPLHRVK